MSLPILLYCFLLISFALFNCIRYKWNRRHLEDLASKLPGPKAWPVIGNLLFFKGVTNKVLLNYITELAHRYYNERLVRIWFGPTLCVGIFKPEEFEVVLRNAKTTDRCIYTFFHETSAGVIASDGERWRKQKKLANTLFNTHLEQFLNIFNEKSRTLTSCLMKKSSSETFNVHRTLSSSTLDIISRTAIGVEMNIQEDETVSYPTDFANEIVCSQTNGWNGTTLRSQATVLQIFWSCGNMSLFHKEILHVITTTRVAHFNDISDVQRFIILVFGGMVERLYKPWLYPIHIFKMSDIGRGTFQRIKSLHQFVLTVINRRRELLMEMKEKANEAINSKNEDTHDDSEVNEQKALLTQSSSPFYIDAMLEYAEAENISDQQLVKEVNDIVFSGMDTTALVIANFLVMIAIYKEWQEKIHREIDELFSSSGRDVTQSDVAKLRNLDLVMKEVLRLYAIPHSLRFLPEDINLGKYTVPGGTIIYLSTYFLHRDPAYWSHPNNFHPEHFFPENVASRPKHSYLPFLMGNRRCPGSKYGLLSAKVALIHILRKFRVECDLKFEELEYQPCAMLELIGGYPVRMIPRQPST